MAEATRADDLLVETIDALLADQSPPEAVGAAEASEAGWDPALWRTLEDGGLTLVGIAESVGGSGGTLHDAVAVLVAAGFHAAAVPVGETHAAASLLAAAGLAVPAGPLAVLAGGVAAEQAGGHWRVQAEGRSPWAPVAGHVVVTAQTAVPAGTGDGRGVVAVLPAADVTVAGTGRNYAGEPWADLRVDAVVAADRCRAVPGFDAGAARVAGALARAAAMVGALQRAVDLSVQYAQEREQFGRPIGRFQVLQHYLAEMAGEAAAARAAVENATDVIAAGAPPSDAVLSVGAAKAYAGRAVATINRLAHQLHGAIGFTDEHRLQYTTRRLWAWRDEHGSEAEWAAAVGAAVCGAGGASLWGRVTAWPPPVG